jgi:hypothetical protein
VIGIITAQFIFVFFFRRRLAIALQKVAGAANMNNNAEVETKTYYIKPADTANYSYSLRPYTSDTGFRKDRYRQIV